MENEKYLVETDTPGWDRFKKAIENHTEWLKMKEKEDRYFKCDCPLCKMGP